MKKQKLIVRQLGITDYLETWQAMKDFTLARTPVTCDEVWLLEHHPVFTQGQNGKPEHVLNPGNIPIIQTDRGGQVTYHGPGQLMVYTLFDLKRLGLGIRDFVSALENCVIQLLAQYHITAISKRDAPGVYVDGKKICSIGLRVKKGCSYHGLAFNIHMDLTPFTGINPCGYLQLKMTQTSDLNGPKTISEASEQIIRQIQLQFGFNELKLIRKGVRP